jgi:hypothetical protein
VVRALQPTTADDDPYWRSLSAFLSASAAFFSEALLCVLMVATGLVLFVGFPWDLGPLLWRASCFACRSGQ